MSLASCSLVRISGEKPHSRTVLSELAVTMRRSSGLNSALLTLDSGPLSSASSRLLFMLVAAGASIEPLRSTIAESLCTSDLEEAASMDSIVEHHGKTLGNAELAAILPQVRSPQLVNLMASVLYAQRFPRLMARQCDAPRRLFRRLTSFGFSP